MLLDRFLKFTFLRILKRMKNKDGKGISVGPVKLAVMLGYQTAVHCSDIYQTVPGLFCHVGISDNKKGSTSCLLQICVGFLCCCWQSIVKS